MATENDWIDTNIYERLIVPSLSYRVYVKPYPFHEMKFQDAADYTARRIYEKHKKIYVALSGGADSDFVVRVFHRNDIPFEVIIVKTSGNLKELEYAFRICEEFDIKPNVIEIDDVEYLKFYYNNVIKKLFGYGIYAIPSIVACQYARDNDGVLVIGEHMIEGEKPDKDGVVRIRPAMNEWDSYNEALVGKEYNIPFFLYTLEIAYAMLTAIDDTKPIDVWKCDLYEVEPRPIMGYEFSDIFMKTAQKVSTSSGNIRTAKPNYDFDKQQLLGLLESWKIL
jgi:hypothetical protein